MKKEDVIGRLGEPDKILSLSEGMRSAAWRCSTCGKVFEFQSPVRPPAPCYCGGIAFEKIPCTTH